MYKVVNSLEWYCILQVGKGDVIGSVSKSQCEGMNHIHLAIMKGRGAVDPSKYLEKRPLKFPEWKQQCDDYKLVFKVRTFLLSNHSGHLL